MVSWIGRRGAHRGQTGFLIVGMAPSVALGPAADAVGIEKRVSPAPRREWIPRFLRASSGRSLVRNGRERPAARAGDWADGNSNGRLARAPLPQTAKALGLNVPETLLATAGEHSEPLRAAPTANGLFECLIDTASKQTSLEISAASADQKGQCTSS
jgi:hypothetical protein